MITNITFEKKSLIFALNKVIFFHFLVLFYNEKPLKNLFALCLQKIFTAKFHKKNFLIIFLVSKLIFFFNLLLSYIFFTIE